ncbi:macronuclear development protein 1 [Stylonychia lemnae]|uniref:Macronuclear development protein 1 n=1 Tax=Stylonychia lemnae TaxID=5949 RepID=A0A078B765_STYLE|nr:macronuclear development protein 1 [Stylonychia lemnae]|eukprot:CDW90249.1 macronuclear development protein 1 [Stylonychia lemnae]
MLTKKSKMTQTQKLLMMILTMTQRQFGQNQQIKMTLKVWPGFYSAMQKLESGPLLLLDLTNKVVRKDKVLTTIQDMESRNCSHDQIQDVIKNSIVVTSYGQAKKTYRIDRVDFEKTPQSTFLMGKEEKEITFGEYYQQRYQVRIHEPNQPLLISISERTGIELALIPELCEMTGLTDSQRSNFPLMKDLNQILHKDARTRINEATELINQFQNQTKVKKVIDQWNINFEPQPYQVEGQRIIGGEILMGKSQGGNRKAFSVDCKPQDFDRNIQQEMYSQIQIKNWGIFFQKYHQKEADIFVRELLACVQTFNYNASKPALIQIQGQGYQAWESMLRQKLNPEVQFAVIIAPGNKGKSEVYDQIKKILTQTLPVPSQVVLASTLSKGRNIRSIVNKILIQINAKLGGEPWALSDMPFLRKPTMIVGYDIHHKKRQKSLLAICVTINQQANRYWSKVYEQSGEMDEIVKGLDKVFIEAMEAFKLHNKVYPQQIIIYRDGVGESQKKVVISQEIDQIQKALLELKQNDSSKFIFVMVNKRVKARFMLDNGGGRLDNAQPGTVIDHSVTPNNTYDFFLISQACKQGVASPSHYTILFDNINSNAEDIIKLTYRLCYLYFNFSGPVKIPAPVKYADKLAKMMGERGNLKPHKHYEEIKGLYYI